MKKCSIALLVLAAFLFVGRVYSQLPAKGPNLIIAGITTDKVVYAPGETVKSKITVRNTGVMPAKGSIDAPGAGYFVDIILSADGVAPVDFAVVPVPYVFAEDMLVTGGRMSNTPTLAPGASHTFALDFPLPKVMTVPCSRAMVNVGAVIDPGKKIAETIEKDNTSFRNLKLTCVERPDLIISYMALADPVGGPGQDFSALKVEVKNIGRAVAKGTDTDPGNGYMVDIITSKDNNAPVVYAPVAADGQFPEDKLVIGGRLSNTKTLGPGQSHIYVMEGMKLPKVDLANYCGRNFYMGGVVDSGRKITEGNEGNNLKFIPFKVVCMQGL